MEALRRIAGFETFSLMQGMLFDLITATPAHQDWYYLDSVPSGNLIAAWIALEDGREDFSYCRAPRHKISVPKMRVVPTPNGWPSFAITWQRTATRSARLRSVRAMCFFGIRAQCTDRCPLKMKPIRANP